MSTTIMLTLDFYLDDYKDQISTGKIIHRKKVYLLGVDEVAPAHLKLINNEEAAKLFKDTVTAFSYNAGRKIEYIIDKKQNHDK